MRTSVRIQNTLSQPVREHHPSLRAAGSPHNPSRRSVLRFAAHRSLGARLEVTRSDQGEGGSAKTSFAMRNAVFAAGTPQ
jgi:hypothetical protein